MLCSPRPISKQIRMISNKFKELWDRKLLQYNLTSSQMDILIYLKFHKSQEIHQREIEQWFQLKNPTVTGLLNRLEEKGFIIRKMNPADKRYRVIELTDKAEQLLADLGEKGMEMDEKIYHCLSQEEQDVLTELLNRILISLSKS